MIQTYHIYYNHAHLQNLESAFTHGLTPMVLSAIFDSVVAWTLLDEPIFRTQQIFLPRFHLVDNAGGLDSEPGDRQYQSHKA